MKNESEIRERINKLETENNILKYKLHVTLKEKDRWNFNCNAFYNVCKKQRKTLQEIKAIAEQTNVDCIYRISVIREILTKTEEE